MITQLLSKILESELGTSLLEASLITTLISVAAIGGLTVAAGSFEELMAAAFELFGAAGA